MPNQLFILGIRHFLHKALKGHLSILVLVFKKKPFFEFTNCAFFVFFFSSFFISILSCMFFQVTRPQRISPTPTHPSTQCESQKWNKKFPFLGNIKRTKRNEKNKKFIAAFNPLNIACLARSISISQRQDYYLELYRLLQTWGNVGHNGVIRSRENYFTHPTIRKKGK